MAAPQPGFVLVLLVWWCAGYAAGQASEGYSAWQAPQPRLVVAPTGTFVSVLNSFMATGEAYDSLPASSLCQCRQQCFVDPRCMALSYHPGQERCYRSKYPTPNSNIPGAVYEYKVKSLTRGDDGLFYVTLDTPLIPRDRCVQMCSNMTGFHLPFAKTRVSMDYLRSFPRTFIGLTKNRATGAITWDDGTPLNRVALGLSSEPFINNGCGTDATSPSPVIFVMYNGLIDDTCTHGMCACQADFSAGNN
ncbi:uncharacterized protein LOC108672626 [Hyalella azteca]|uniref:Uncharacterized protein LOC108672626 n=1 Tax=Hyalella azteca TaxID=294128 RepID=A0A8B7NRX5_HYAAZ|nr:uncharacterized protein LOC108672626 [Hyalella azteca]